jgi:hypothetical protein
VRQFLQQRDVQAAEQAIAFGREAQHAIEPSPCRQRRNPRERHEHEPHQQHQPHISKRLRDAEAYRLRSRCRRSS